MKLRNKVLLFIFTASAIMFLVILMGIKYFLINHYLQVQGKFSADAFLRVKAALEQQIKQVAQTAKISSEWDVAYKYTFNESQDFINQALSVPSIAVSNLDTAVIFGVRGNILFKRFLDEARTEFTAFPVTLVEAFQPGGSLWKFVGPTSMSSSGKPQSNNIKQGLFAIHNEILIIAIHSIVKSGGAGPAHGKIFFARRLTADRWKAIQDTTRITAKLFPIGELLKDPVLKQRYDTLLSSDLPVLLDRISKETIHVYGTLEDVNNKPIAMIKLILPRSIYMAGMRTINRFIILFSLSGILFTLLLFYLLRKIILDPLENINKEIISAGETRNFQTRIAIKGANEISSLGKEFNKMFKTVWQYDEQNKKFKQDVSQKLEQSNLLRIQLQKAQTLFSDIINSMPSMLIVIDEHMKILRMNNFAMSEAASRGFNQNEGSDAPRQQGELQAHMTNEFLLELFPWLAPYEKNISSILNADRSRTITKIMSTEQDKTRYFNALIFPLTKGKTLGIRIDEVTEFIKLQEQVLQNDKMASIGMLTTGMVNEIKTPVRACLTVVEPLKNSLDTIIALVRQYDVLVLDNTLPDRLIEMEKSTREPEINQLSQETLGLLDTLQKNSAEIASIVRTLQNYSRLEEDVIKKIDLCEAVNSTLKLLLYKYRNRINVVKHFEKIPAIDSCPGRLNQVLLNIISNALDSMQGSGELTIKVLPHGTGQVLLSFKDTGAGMNPDNGSVSGLSLTRTIIDDLHGTFEVKSKPGEGTEVVVILPVHVKQEV